MSIPMPWIVIVRSGIAVRTLSAYGGKDIGLRCIKDIPTRSTAPRNIVRSFAFGDGAELYLALPLRAGRSNCHPLGTAIRCEIRRV
jgi:hypothetical protein